MSARWTAGSQLLRVAALSSLLTSTAVAQAPVPGGAPGSPAVYAFTDVNVVPMDRERVIVRQHVIVRDGRIAAMGPAASTPIPAGAIRIDGRGRYLAPGLGDAHAHLSMPGTAAPIAERALTLYALHGVTMVRSMFTEPHHRDAAARVERGEIIGPRTLLASEPVHGGNSRTVAAMRELVTQQRGHGHRLIKVLPGLPRPVFDTLVIDARAAGLALAGHVPPNVGLGDALAAGFASIEHLDGILEATVPPAAAATPGGFFGLGVIEVVDTARLAGVIADVRRSGVMMVPTEFSLETYTSMEAVDAFVARPEMRFVPPALIAQWRAQKEGFARDVGLTAERATRYHELRRRIIRELAVAGVPLALGSDGFTLFGVPGNSTQRELEIYVASGLSPYAALASATTGVARLLDMPGVSGTIAVGSAADLILLEANPLQDIRAVRLPLGVMLRGSWLTRAQLDERLATLRF